MKSLFKWTQGRKYTGYSVFTLAKFGNTERVPVGFDCYLVKYPVGASIPPHKDVAPNGKKHLRLNIILARAEGGDFNVANAIFKSSRVNLFRPDIEEHSVTTVVKGTRYVLSFGLAY